MTGYETSWGHMVEPMAAAPPSWGNVPTSSYPGASPYLSYPPQEAFPLEFSEAREYADPKAAAEAQEKKTKRRALKKRRNISEAHTVARGLMLTGILAMLFWIIPCFGTGWHKRMFAGTGIGMLEIRTGLFMIDIKVDCYVMDWGILDMQYITGNDEWKNRLHQMNPDEQLCKIVQKFSGTRSLYAAKDLACALNNNACQIMSLLADSSLILLFFFTVSALIEGCAAFFLYYYWDAQHLKKIRNWSMGLFVLAPCVGIIGIGVYMLLAPDIGDVPRSWTNFVRHINPGIPGFGEINPIHGQDVIVARYGWCFFGSFFALGISVAAPISWATWFRNHPDEKEHVKAAELEMQQMEDAIEAIAQQEDDVRAKACPSDNNWSGASAYSEAYAGAYAQYGGGAQAHAAPHPGVAGFSAYGAYGSGSPYAQQTYPGTGY